MVKIQIYITFTPRHGENSDLHHAMVKIQIYTTFSPHHEGLWRFGDNPLRIDWNIDENV